VKGGKGRAKTTLLRICRLLTDPSQSPNRLPSGGARDLFIYTANSWVLAFDNISSCPGWLSDALSSIATGGSYSTRALYTNDEEIVFSAAQPVAIAGIQNIFTKEDLLERSIVLELPEIDGTQRRAEDEFWQEFTNVYPSIFGALCDTVAVALKNIGQVTFEKLPRMADFAKWVVAAEDALPFAKGSFMNAYLKNQYNVMNAAASSNPVAAAVQCLMQDRNIWRGSPADTLEALENQPGVTYRITVSKDWPGAPNKLRMHLENIRAFLQDNGIVMDLDGKVQGEKIFAFLNSHMTAAAENNYEPKADTLQGIADELANGIIGLDYPEPVEDEFCEVMMDHDYPEPIENEPDDVSPVQENTKSIEPADSGYGKSIFDTTSNPRGYGKSIFDVD